MRLFGSGKLHQCPNGAAASSPVVAASATLGTSRKRNFNRNAVASLSPREFTRQTQPRCG